MSFQQAIKSMRKTFQGNPELFFPVAILIVWRVLTARPSLRGLWVDGALVTLLCWYGCRVLDATQWMERLGWSKPRPIFWGWSATAGFLCALLILGLAKGTGHSLGTARSMHLLLLASTVGPMLEELFFRGLLYWALHKTMRHFGMPIQIVYPASVTLLAVLFAFGHFGSDAVHLWAAIFTGIAFGSMRVASGSTACAAVMHASYNFALCWLALIFTL